MKQMYFKTKAQYALYLKHAFQHSLKSEDFNIFLHSVTTSYPRKTKIATEKEEVLSKVQEILQFGLNLDGGKERCPYGSICGTARFMGNAKNINIDDVINYYFSNNSRYVNTIILAIPKYIELTTGKHEFSSSNGALPTFNQFNKSCLLDISKEQYLPTAFIFGYQLLDKETNTIKFWQNDHHFSQLSHKSQKGIMQGFSNRIESTINYCKRHHNAKSINDVFDIMTRKHLVFIEDYFNDI